LPNKVFCKECPCFSYSSIPHCNLEHKVILVKDCYVSNECELEFINAGGWQFRPTKRAVDLPPAAFVKNKRSVAANH
jgi:hypothetical protein